MLGFQACGSGSACGVLHVASRFFFCLLFFWRFSFFTTFFLRPVRASPSLDESSRRAPAPRARAPLPSERRRRRARGGRGLGLGLGGRRERVELRRARWTGSSGTASASTSGRAGALRRSTSSSHAALSSIFPTGLPLMERSAAPSCGFAGLSASALLMRTVPLARSTFSSMPSSPWNVTVTSLDMITMPLWPRAAGTPRQSPECDRAEASGL